MAIKIEKGKIPIWEKYMLTVDEAVQYFGIGEKKIRMLISEHLNSECCFTVQVGCKSLTVRNLRPFWIRLRLCKKYTNNLAL